VDRGERPAPRERPVQVGGLALAELAPLGLARIDTHDALLAHADFEKNQDAIDGLIAEPLGSGDGRRR
jgi:hypothetical protein